MAAVPTPDIESPITKDWQHGGIKIRKWRVSGERCALRDEYWNGITGIMDLDMRARRESLASDW